MALNEALKLGSIELNPLSGTFSLEALDLTPPPKKPEWAQNSDADGADLVRTPLFENRTVTASIRVNPAANMNTALEKIGEIVDQLQEAEKNPNGITLEWTPANSTKTITFYVLTGAVTGLPIMVEGTPGWFQAAPLLVVSMICKPFGYGAEVEASGVAKTIETGLSIVVLTLPSVAGDVPAEGRLVIKDTAAVARRFVEWGIQNRYYDAATSLILDNEAMTAVGGTGEPTLTGAYKPGAGNATIKTVLIGEPTICANTGNLKHVGTYRVKARVQMVLGTGSSLEKTHLRLSYQDGEGPLRANGWQTPPVANKFVEVDLGVITLTPAITGSQKWLGQIEAYSTNAAVADVLHLDYLTFIPVLEGYGKARGVQTSAPGRITAFENFSTSPFSGGLNERTPAVGEKWAAGVGAATDWVVSSGKAVRSTVSDSERRFDVLGSSQTNSSVIVSGLIEGTTGAEILTGAVLRWTNKENYVFAQLRFIEGANYQLQLGMLVANVETRFSLFAYSGVAFRPAWSIALSATSDGAVVGVLTFGGIVTTATGNTGGALASGLAGVFDQNTTNKACARTIKSVNVQSLPAPPVCVQASQALEIRSDSTIAHAPSENFYGPVPQYRGSRFYVPQKGSAARTSRIIVKADRNDLQESDQQTIADAFTAQAFITPRFHVVPR